MLLSELPAAIHALLEGQSASVAGAPAALAFDAWATVAAEPLDDPNVEYERYIYEAGPDRPGTWIFAVSREIGFHDGNDEYVETKYLSYLAHFDRACLPGRSTQVPGRTGTWAGGPGPRSRNLRGRSPRRTFVRAREDARARLRGDHAGLDLDPSLRTARAPRKPRTPESEGLQGR